MRLGKVHSSHKVMYIPQHGQEVNVGTNEVLVQVWNATLIQSKDPVDNHKMIAQYIILAKIELWLRR